MSTGTIIRNLSLKRFLPAMRPATRRMARVPGYNPAYHEAIRTALKEAETRGIDPQARYVLHQTLSTIWKKHPVIAGDTAALEGYAKLLIDEGYKLRSDRTAVHGASTLYSKLQRFIEALPDEKAANVVALRSALEAAIMFTRKFNCDEANGALAMLISRIPDETILDSEKFKGLTNTLLLIGVKLANYRIKEKEYDAQKDTDIEKDLSPTSLFSIMAGIIKRLPPQALADSRIIKEYGDVLLNFRIKGSKYRKSDDILLYFSRHMQQVPDIFLTDRKAFETFLGIIAMSAISQDDMYADFPFNRMNIFTSSLSNLLNALPEYILADKEKLYMVLRTWGDIIIRSDDPNEWDRKFDKRLLREVNTHLLSGLVVYLEAAKKAPALLNNYFVISLFMNQSRLEVLFDTFVTIGIMNDAFNVRLGKDDVTWNLDILRDNVVTALKKIEISGTNLHKFLMIPVYYLNRAVAKEAMIKAARGKITDFKYVEERGIDERLLDDIRTGLQFRSTARWWDLHRETAKMQSDYFPRETYADVFAWPLAGLVLLGGNPVARMINSSASSFYFNQYPIRWRNVGGIRQKISDILARSGYKVEWINERGNWRDTRTDIVRDSRDQVYMGFMTIGEKLARCQSPLPLPPMLEQMLINSHHRRYGNESPVLRKLLWKANKMGLDWDSLEEMLEVMTSRFPDKVKESSNLLEEYGNILIEAGLKMNENPSHLANAKELYKILHLRHTEFFFQWTFRAKNVLDVLARVLWMSDKDNLSNDENWHFNDLIDKFLGHLPPAILDDKNALDGHLNSLLSIIEAAKTAAWKTEVIYSRDGLCGELKDLIDHLPKDVISEKESFDIVLKSILSHIERQQNPVTAMNFVRVYEEILITLPPEVTSDKYRFAAVMGAFNSFLAFVMRNKTGPLNSEVAVTYLVETLRRIPEKAYSDMRQLKNVLDMLPGLPDGCSMRIFTAALDYLPDGSMLDRERLEVLKNGTQKLHEIFPANENDDHEGCNSISSFIRALPAAILSSNAGLKATLEAAYDLARFDSNLTWLTDMNFFLGCLDKSLLQPEMIKQLFACSTEHDARYLQDMLVCHYELNETFKVKVDIDPVDMERAKLNSKLISALRTALDQMKMNADTMKMLQKLPSRFLKEAGIMERVMKELRALIPDIPDDIEYYNEAGFISSAIKLIEHWEEMSKEDNNIPYLFEMLKRYGSIESYYRAEKGRILDKLQQAGFDVAYILSGKHVLSRQISGTMEMAGEKHWKEMYLELMKRMLGTRQSKPEIFCAFNRVPRKLVYKLNHLNNGREQFNRAKEGDGEAAKEVAAAVLAMIEAELKAEKNKRRSRILEDWHDRLSGMVGRIDEEEKEISTRGIRAVRSRKLVPEILFDNHRIGCCIFWPDGVYKEEIALILLDPKTPLLEIWPAGSSEFMGVVTQYLGTNTKGEPVVFVDTVENSHAMYGMLGRNFSQRFTLDAAVLDAYRMGAKELAMYQCPYGTPLEFANMIKNNPQLGEVIKTVDNYQFQAVDVEDRALADSRNIESPIKPRHVEPQYDPITLELDPFYHLFHNEEQNTPSSHHYTDAFGHNEPLKGASECYVIDVAAYIERILKMKPQKDPHDGTLLPLKERLSGIASEKLSIETVPRLSKDAVREIMALEKRAYQERLHYSAEYFDQLSKNSGFQAILIKDPFGQLVGFAMGYAMNAETFYLDNIAFNPYYRGHGMGREVLNAILGIAKDNGSKTAVLQCPVKDIDGRDLPEFFRKAGFTPVRVYSGNVRMERPL